MMTQALRSSRGESPRDRERTTTVSLAADRRLTYAAYGQAGGTPVVFLHGTPGSRRLGELFEAAAREHGIRILAPDRPGYGRSSPWPERSVRDAERFVAPVLDDAGVDTAGLVAFSGGAPYAFAAAATRPDRIERVDVVAGAPPPEFVDETPAVQRLLRGMATTTPALLRGAFRAQAWVARRRDPSFVLAQYTTGDTAATVPERAAEIVREDFLEAVARHRSGVVTEFGHVGSDWGIEPEEIDADVRLWHGEQDTNVPISGVRRFASSLPAAELRVFDDADHLRTLLRSVPEILAEHQ